MQESSTLGVYDLGGALGGRSIGCYPDRGFRRPQPWHAASRRRGHVSALVVGALIMLVVVLVASVVPAMNVVRFDPNRVLRGK